MVLLINFNIQNVTLRFCHRSTPLDVTSLDQFFLIKNIVSVTFCFETDVHVTANFHVESQNVPRSISLSISKCSFFSLSTFYFLNIIQDLFLSPYNVLLSAMEAYRGGRGRSGGGEGVVCSAALKTKIFLSVSRVQLDCNSFFSIRDETPDMSCSGGQDLFPAKYKVS